MKICVLEEWEEMKTDKVVNVLRKKDDLSQHSPYKEG